jgi:acyl-CoA thioester hydrolase
LPYSRDSLSFTKDLWINLLSMVITFLAHLPRSCPTSPEPPAVPPDQPNRPSHATPERFELAIKVQEADIDQLGHVNNVVYLRWVQDAAVAHWRATATPAQQAALIWVVVRHEIDYAHAARQGDDVVAQTWVGIATKRTFERHTEIRRAQDQTLLARACTLWCPINARTGRPARVDADVRARFSVPSAE